MTTKLVVQQADRRNNTPDRYGYVILPDQTGTVYVSPIQWATSAEAVDAGIEDLAANGVTEYEVVDSTRM